MLGGSQAGGRPAMPGAASLPYDTSMPDFLRQVAPSSSLGAPTLDSSAFAGASLGTLGSDHPVTPAYEKAAAALNFKVASGASFAMDSDPILANPTGPPPGKGLPATMSNVEALPDASITNGIKAKDSDAAYGYSGTAGMSMGDGTGPSGMYASAGMSSLGGYGALGTLPGELSGMYSSMNGSAGMYGATSAAPFGDMNGGYSSANGAYGGANGSSSAYAATSAPPYGGINEAALPTQDNTDFSGNMFGGNPLQTTSPTSGAPQDRGATPLPYGRGRVSNGAGTRGGGTSGYESSSSMAYGQQPNGTYSDGRMGVSEPAGGCGFPSAGSFVAEAYTDDGMPTYSQYDKMTRSEVMAAAMSSGARSASPMRGAAMNGTTSNGYMRENGYGAYPQYRGSSSEYGPSTSYQSRPNQYSLSAPSMGAPNTRMPSPMDRGSYGRSGLVSSGSFVATPYGEGAPTLDMLGSPGGMPSYAASSMAAYRGRSESPMGARAGYGLAPSGSFVASPFADGAPTTDMLGGMPFGAVPPPLSMGGYGDLYGQAPPSTSSPMYGSLGGQKSMGLGYPGSLGGAFDADPFQMPLGAGSYGMGPQRGSLMSPSSNSFAAMGPQPTSFLASLDSAQPSMGRVGLDSPMSRPGDMDSYAGASNGMSKRSNGANGLDGPPRSSMRKEEEDFGGPSPGPGPPKQRSSARRERDRDGNPPRIKKKQGRGCC